VLHSTSELKEIQIIVIIIVVVIVVIIIKGSTAQVS
jgi:hypothetical protein